LIWLGSPFWRGFGAQAVGWGLVDAAIALLGRWVSQRRRAALTDSGGDPLSPDVLERQARNLRRLLWVNTGLDVLYVAGGLALAMAGIRCSGPSLAGMRAMAVSWRGHGWGIVAQGGFLFFFDLIHARRA
jgi:hypothetical protein